MGRCCRGLQLDKVYACAAKVGTGGQLTPMEQQMIKRQSELGRAPPDRWGQPRTRTRRIQAAFDSMTRAVAQRHAHVRGVVDAGAVLTGFEYMAPDEVQQPEWPQAISGHRLPRRKPRGKRVPGRSLRSPAASRHRGAAAASGVPGGAPTSSASRRARLSGRDGRRPYQATASNAKNRVESACRVEVCDLSQHARHRGPAAASTHRAAYRGRQHPGGQLQPCQGCS